jgi:hypothetical protein
MLIQVKAEQGSFVMSHGWFNHFRNCENLYNVSGEEVSADTVAEVVS